MATAGSTLQKTRSFEMPDLSDIPNLLVERIGENALQPSTPVVCLNRGRKVLTDTWDGTHVPLPPGHFITEYGAALHFQRRLIVPGTRNLEIGGFISWIAILGSVDGRIAVDQPDMCEPFTDDELQGFGERIEGLSSEGRGDLVPLRTSAARAMSRAQGAGLRPQIDAGQQASDAAREAAEHVFDPVDANDRDATAAAQEAAAEGVVAGADSRPEPRPMKGPKKR